MSYLSPDDPAWAVILAAGSGSRMAQASMGQPKQFLEWRGVPIYWHSALSFARCSLVNGIVFVFPEIFLGRENDRLKELDARFNLGLPWKACAGGAARQDSARLGIAQIPQTVKKVLVHDAARPFASPKLIWSVCRAICDDSPGVVPVLPVADTLKVDSEEKPDFVVETPPRSHFWLAQTPQGFDARLLRAAHGRFAGCSATDDASLFEQMDLPVKMIEGEAENIKITVPADLKALREDAVSVPATGFGYDVHRFGPGHPLKLGGVEIPGGFEVIAHSDGDVLLHALMDAIFGASCLGDLGAHFPDSDPAYAGISSAVLLDQALSLAKRASFNLAHVDATVVCQKPKLAPYATQIRQNIARLLGLQLEMVNFKATTEEGLGFTGTLDGIKAYAVASGLRKIG